MLVQMIDQVLEILRRSIAAGRRKVSSGLVAPRSEKGVFHDRQEFNVSEATGLDVSRQLDGQFAVRE